MLWALAILALVILTAEPGARGLLLYGWWSVPAPESYRVPVESIERSSLRSSWGAPRSGNRTHKGIDISGPRGTAVVATTSGVVIRVGTNRLGGRIVWVFGRPLTRYYYAHLEDWHPELREGMWVEAGQVLGYVGDSGNARGTGTHLHFGMYPFWKAFYPVDPFPYLAD